MRRGEITGRGSHTPLSIETPSQTRVKIGRPSGPAFSKKPRRFLKPCEALAQVLGPDGGSARGYRQLLMLYQLSKAQDDWASLRLNKSEA